MRDGFHDSAFFVLGDFLLDRYSFDVGAILVLDDFAFIGDIVDSALTWVRKRYLSRLLGLSLAKTRIGLIAISIVD